MGTIFTGDMCHDTFYQPPWGTRSQFTDSRPAVADFSHSLDRFCDDLAKDIILESMEQANGQSEPTSAGELTLRRSIGLWRCLRSAPWSVLRCSWRGPWPATGARRPLLAYCCWESARSISGSDRGSPQKRGSVGSLCPGGGGRYEDPPPIETAHAEALRGVPPAVRASRRSVGGSLRSRAHRYESATGRHTMSASRHELRTKIRHLNSTFS